MNVRLKPFSFERKDLKYANIVSVRGVEGVAVTVIEQIDDRFRLLLKVNKYFATDEVRIVRCELQDIKGLIKPINISNAKDVYEWHCEY